ncbi:hypothetical protein PAXRUDRAFT_213829 [Paxillus rubicundulus Ve08.2h10]|uniref:Amino acid permease/ SLC12A domain-containing protein n=1 Tax=Paxillus rubicundulus Ve08.2h10 TaxID=930991 RepID=A0A0D0CE06_9AGAM|nr:hypothetical protein PAXRUDRAFT_213829 [Paxillus rubicundulus Ve08.2h10]
MPKAVRNVYIRMLLFYIAGVVVITGSLLVLSNEPSLNLESSNESASPFVIAIEKAGTKGLTSTLRGSLATGIRLRTCSQVINAALLTSAWSAATSDIYLPSRGVYGFALSGNAFKIFTPTSRSGLPYRLRRASICSRGLFQPLGS